MRGKEKNRILKLKAKHALSDREGKFYEYLTVFPGILFDEGGYVIFADKKTYEGCSAFQFVEKVHVVNGISKIAGYHTFTKEQKELLESVN